MLVAFFRHVHEHLSVSARVLTQHEAKPRSKMAAILKFCPFTNRRNNGCGGFGANAFHFSNTLTGFRLFKNGVDLFIKKSYTPFEI